MDENYKYQIYDDIFHLTKYHQRETTAIMELTIEVYKLAKCDAQYCNSRQRHYRVNDHNHSDQTSDTNEDELKYLSLYRDTMDTLHFYLFHLIEGGYRLNKNEE